jgi:hypothetical protein
MLMDGADDDGALGAPGPFLHRQVSDFQGLESSIEQEGLGLPPSWEHGAAAQLQALVADVEAAGRGDAAGAGAGGANPAAAAAAAQRQQSLNLRSVSFPGGGGGGAAAAAAHEEARGRAAGDGEPRMVPIEAAGEARLPSPHSPPAPHSAGGGAARGAAPLHRVPVVAASAGGVPHPRGGGGGGVQGGVLHRPPPVSASRGGGGGRQSQAAVAAMVAAMVESMGREQLQRAERRQDEATAAGGPRRQSSMGDEASDALEGAIMAFAEPEPGSSGGGGGPFLRRELGQMSTTAGKGGAPRAAPGQALVGLGGPDADAAAAADPFAITTADAAARAGELPVASDMPDIALLEAAGGVGDLVDEAVARLQDAGAEPVAWARPAAAAGGGDGDWRRQGRAGGQQQQLSQQQQQYAMLHRQLEGIQKQQHGQQGGALSGQMRTASGRLQGWPGALPQAQGHREVPSPSTARGAASQQQNHHHPAGPGAAAGPAWQKQDASGVGDGDTDMEIDGELEQRSQDPQLHHHHQQQQQQQQARSYSPPPSARARSGGSGLLLPGSCEGMGGSEGAAGQCCLNCTATLFGPRCDGCGHASHDDVALLQGRLPPIEEAEPRRIRQARACDSACVRGCGCRKEMLAYCLCWAHPLQARSSYPLPSNRNPLIRNRWRPARGAPPRRSLPTTPACCSTAPAPTRSAPSAPLPSWRASRPPASPTAAARWRAAAPATRIWRRCTRRRC